MDGNNTTPQPQTENRVPPTPSESSAAGPIVGAIIIVAILILGGLYYWGAYLEERDRANLTAEDILNQPDAATDALRQQSASDEASSIEADLNATDLENLTTDLESI